MRQPSEQLIATLGRLELCSPEQIRSCEPIVRHLARDLPEFDSVWLDALVQQRHLTPWQVDQIQSGRADEIRVADLVLSSPEGRHSWRASQIGSRREFLVRRIVSRRDTETKGMVDQLESVLQQVDEVRARSPRSLLLPERIVVRDESAEEGSEQAYTVTAWPGGWTGNELLVRGGRLPCAAVAEMGRELLTALTWLEQHRLLHGDIQLDHFRLTSAGTVVLTDAFVRQIESPGLPLTPSLELRDLDGLAPELVGTGRTPDIRCELYAVGCLLWQLLTSRPVVLTADPVTRLVKQRSHDIADPRTFVPDCPEWLARQIMTLTRRVPELRPASAEQALAQWLEDGPPGRSHCRALARQLPDRSRRTSRLGGVTRWSGRRVRRILAGTAAAALLSLAGYGISTDQIPNVLRLPERRPTAAETAHSAALPSNGELATQLGNSGAVVGPLPHVDEQGVIHLEGGRRYLARDVSFDSALVIRCDSTTELATIEVDPAAGWKLSAPQLTVQSVSIVVGSPTSTEPAAERQQRSQSLMTVSSADLTVRHCRIPSSPGAGDAGIAMQWTPSARGSNVANNVAGTSSSVETHVEIHDTVFSGRGTALWLHSGPAHLNLDNVLLATRSGALRADFREPGAHRVSARLHRVTQRFGGSLFDIAVLHAGVSTVALDAVCGECVFAPTTGLIRFVAPELWAHDQLSVRFLLPDTGNPAIIAPESARMVYLDRELRQLVEAAPERLQRDCLLYAVPVFADADGAVTGVAASEIIDFEGPKLSRVMPGIVAAEMPEVASDHATTTQ